MTCEQLANPGLIESNELDSGGLYRIKKIIELEGIESTVGCVCCQRRPQYFLP